MVLGASAMLLVLAFPAFATLVAAGALVAGAAAALARHRARARGVVVAADRVLETCELLASELESGQPNGVALDRAAQEWPPLRPAADALRLGGDVPGALRRVGETPGAADLRILAGAWQVAQGSGGGLALASRLVADDLRGAHRTRRVIEAELSSARATARLVALLPVPVVLLSGAGGTRAWSFLLTGWGVGCLAAGLALTLAGLWWIEAIAGGVWRGG